MGTGPVSCPSCGHENPAGARFCNDELRGPGEIRSRPESSRARGFSRFVGERELARLAKALRETQSGRPTVVPVSGERGAGKSRLCHEFVERARGVALLQRTSTARTIRVRADEISTTVGPFVETKEQPGEACAVAARVPPARVAVLEIPPVQELRHSCDGRGLPS